MNVMNYVDNQVLWIGNPALVDFLLMLANTSSTKVVWCRLGRTSVGTVHLLKNSVLLLSVNVAVGRCRFSRWALVPPVGPHKSPPVPHKVSGGPPTVPPTTSRPLNFHTTEYQLHGPAHQSGNSCTKWRVYASQQWQFQQKQQQQQQSLSITCTSLLIRVGKSWFW